jgi:crotonobetainyl-CoA:carnitine CoA-transferase CaiB-like acyl-CoA transferase
VFCIDGSFTAHGVPRAPIIVRPAHRCNAVAAIIRAVMRAHCAVNISDVRVPTTPERSLSASTQKMAERVFSSIGRSDLIDDPRYSTNAARVQNAADLDAIIGAFVAERPQNNDSTYLERSAWKPRV